MVGIVLVSHSRPLAIAARELALGVSGGKGAIAIAAGAGDDHAEFGTNAVEIMEAIQSVASEEGVLVLMDMGSALLSTETALGFLDEDLRAKVRCSGAPFIEGAVTASVVAGLGSGVDEVLHEAEAAFRQKADHLRPAGKPSETEAASTGTPVASESGRSVRVTVRNPHGLHARPVARFIREAAAQKADVTVRNLTNSRGPVSARSLSGLASLEVLQGHEIEIAASGPDVDVALNVLQTAVETGLGETEVKATIRVNETTTRRSTPVGVSSGLAIGPLFFVSSSDVTPPPGQVDDPEAEIQRLYAAIKRSQASLAEEEGALTVSIGRTEAEIFSAQALILEDPELIRETQQSIRAQRENAAAAWHKAVQRIVERYDALEDDYLRQRAADVRDIGARVLEMLGVPRRRVGDLPEAGILVVEDLTPAEVASLSDIVLGVICLRGATTSHAAILLRAREIPAIAQAESAIERAHLQPAAMQRTIAAFDGDTGELWIDPAPEKLRAIRELRDRRHAAAEDEAQHRNEPAITTDRHRVEIFANLGSQTEAAHALSQGAEGVGLFRTEFLFLDRADAPSEEEQYVPLRALREAMGTRPVVVRTLDIGGDKEVPYLGLSGETNPFLGVRGIRLCLRHPEMFQTHLRAILRAGEGGDFRLMFPMISEPAELDEARDVLSHIHHGLERDGVPHAWPIPVGIMVEVPSAAMLVEQLVMQADFFSIGTNDLTQYVLAADRGNADLASFHDALHPAVLRLIRQITVVAHRDGRKVAVCGEAAGDPFASQVLIGLGVDELSLTPSRIPAVKAGIRAAVRSELEAVAERVLDLGSAAQVRAVNTRSVPG